MDYIPNDCKYIALVENGEVFSQMTAGHINFFKHIKNDMNSYIRLVENCKTCDKYYMCCHEDKKIQYERNISLVYQAVLEEFGGTKIFYSLKKHLNSNPVQFFNDILMAGLYTYCTHIVPNGLPINTNIIPYKTIHEKLIKNYKELNKVI